MNSSAWRFAAVLAALFCLESVHAAEGHSPVRPKPLIAAVWITPGSAGGKEVVIRPDVEKLKVHGLTLGQLAEALRGRRFVEGQWHVEIGSKDINLADVARLTLRKIQARPFTVKLEDGREVLITPDPERVGHYVITGEDFEGMVREALSNFTGPDPAKCHVLSMIEVPGNVGPHLTEDGTMRHFSVGEPLETFGRTEVQQPRTMKPGGQSE